MIDFPAAASDVCQYREPQHGCLVSRTLHTVAVECGCVRLPGQQVQAGVACNGHKHMRLALPQHRRSLQVTSPAQRLECRMALAAMPLVEADGKSRDLPGYGVATVGEHDQHRRNEAGAKQHEVRSAAQAVAGCGTASGGTNPAAGTHTVICRPTAGSSARWGVAVLRAADLLWQSEY